ncbi:hypothetical protein TrRE_jg10063 [Triparma retinervis]|uniref:Uncharacterized protein n=1 Tax=Triparma retinervis TaxID=2557542 RepID=A0A9W7CER7_9STRA|nr:hypothetical protein TrRE_jg10063 [Triparma retinervis]
MSRGSNFGYSTFNKQMYNVCADDGESNNLLDSTGQVLDSSNAAILSGLLKALSCHDMRTDPAQAQSFVECSLNGEVIDTTSPTPSPTRSPTAVIPFDTLSPTPAETPYPTSSPDGSDGWTSDSLKLIAGGVVGVVLLVLLSCLFCWCCSAKKQKDAPPKPKRFVELKARNLV